MNIIQDFIPKSNGNRPGHSMTAYSGNTNGLGYSQSQINWLVNNALDLQGKEDYQLLIFKGRSLALLPLKFG